MATEAPIRKVSTLCFIGACETCTDQEHCGCQHHFSPSTARELTLHELAYSVWDELSASYQEEHHKNRLYSILIKARNSGIDLRGLTLDQAYGVLHLAMARPDWSLREFSKSVVAAGGAADSYSK